jgi:hypothetical protein
MDRSFLLDNSADTWDSDLLPIKELAKFTKNSSIFHSHISSIQSLQELLLVLSYAFQLCHNRCSILNLTFELTCEAFFQTYKMLTRML